MQDILRKMADDLLGEPTQGDVWEDIRTLKDRLEDMKKEELPREQGEFESRALLYHIMMDNSVRGKYQ